MSLVKQPGPRVDRPARFQSETSNVTGKTTRFLTTEHQLSLSFPCILGSHEIILNLTSFWGTDLSLMSVTIALPLVTKNNF